MSLWRRIYEERRQVILPLFIALVINAGILALVVLPLSRSVAGYQNEAVAAMTRLADAHRLERNAKDARASGEQAVQELKKFYGGILPTSFADARNLAGFWVSRIGEESGVRFKGSSLDYDQVKDSQLVKVTGKVTLIGQYSNIRRFLYEAETAQEFVIIEKVELAQTGAAQQTNSGELEVTLNIATYYVAGGQPGGP